MRRVLVPLACCLAVAGGCGGGGDSDEDQAREVAQGFFEAASNRNWDDACEYTTDIGESGITCEDVVSGIFKDQSADFPEADQVVLDGDTGKVEVTVSGGDIYTALMKKVDDEWKVDDFNYNPQ